MPNERIYIAEDDTVVSEELITRLKSLGFAIAGQSQSSETAILESEKQQPDLVLMEIGLPGEKNGVEAAKFIHDELDIPVVFISAHDSTLSMQAALLARAYGFLVKPFENHELKSNLAMAILKHSMTRKLRESEERYSLAVRAANDGIWDWNLKTNEIYFSPRWKDMLGYPEQAVGSGPEEWFSRVHPDDQKHVQSALTAHLKGIIEHFECEYRIRHANGDYLEYSSP